MEKIIAALVVLGTIWLFASPTNRHEIEPNYKNVNRAEIVSRWR
jgi:hypothetical protein